MKYPKVKKIGLALGSGGIRGLSHIGAIKVLQRHNIPINCTAGSSSGAIIGAYYALRGEVKTLEELALSLTRRDLIKLIDFGRSKRSLIAGKKIKNFLRELYQDKSFKDTLIPLDIVTCDLRNGEIVALNKGKLADAVFASMSAPGLFPPTEINEKLLVDGGVIDPTPVDVVRKMGADVVIGVDLTLASKFETRHPNILISLLRAFDVIRTQAAKYNIENVNKELILIQPKINGGFNLLKQFAEAEKHIHRGELAAMAAIPEIKKLLDR